jgi:hypothetical protein
MKFNRETSGTQSLVVIINWPVAEGSMFWGSTIKKKVNKVNLEALYEEHWICEGCRYRGFCPYCDTGEAEDRFLTNNPVISFMKEWKKPNPRLTTMQNTPDMFGIIADMTRTCTFCPEGLARFNRAKHIVRERWSAWPPPQPTVNWSGCTKTVTVRPWRSSGRHTQRSASQSHSPISHCHSSCQRS